MKQSLYFQAEKSDKFWRIETAGCQLMTNWGKKGTSGRYEIKEFDSAEETEKQGEKLLKAKIKKGYQLVADFPEDGHCYFDSEEYGLHPLTSHPIFRTYFADDLYYDCGDEEAPFGSDEGDDTLAELFKCFRKNPKLDFSLFPKKLIEEIWALTYLAPETAQSDESLLLQAAQKFDDLPGDQELLQSDQIILATALGQIKITGKLHPDLQKLAFLSLERTERLYRLLWGWDKEESPPHVKVIKEDLARFCAEQ